MTRSNNSSCRSMFLKKCFGQVRGGPQRSAHGEQIAFRGTLTELQHPKAFAAWLRPRFRAKSVVYSKRPFGDAQHALRYLGQYTHRVAISNQSTHQTYRWRRHFPLARFGSQKQEASDHAACRRIPCADSCCTCCRQDSSASATLAFWRIAAAAPCFRSALIARRFAPGSGRN